MQWGTFITSVGGAGAVLGVIGYVLKRSFERVLDAKLNESEERHKALITETVRRQAALYDQQFGALKVILELLYRARNAAREIHQSNGKANPQAFSRLRTYHNSMQELLYEQRAILPKEVFHVAHNSKQLVESLLASGERSHRSGQPQTPPEHAADVAEFYKLLEADYQRLVSAVQSHIKFE